MHERITTKNIGDSGMVCSLQITREYDYRSAQEESSIITQLSYADIPLSNEMFVQYIDNHYYLPISILANKLQLPLEVDITTNSVTGWFIDKTKRIDIDKGIMHFWRNNDDCSMNKTILYFDSWDIYVEASVLEQMLGIVISFDISNQIFSIADSSNIPLSQNMERNQRYSLFNTRKNVTTGQSVRKVNKEYSVLGDLVASSDIGVLRKSSTERMELDGYVQARLDLLKNSVYLSYSWAESSDLFSAYVEKELFDSWVYHYQLGTVNSHNLGLISNSNYGRGVRVSAGSQFTSNLRYIVVEGDIEPGWDVELYRNNILIDVQQVKEGGRYHFASVPYYIGYNQYRLKFYGPNGQFRIKDFSKVLNSSMLDLGGVGVNFGFITETQSDLKQYYTDINWAVSNNWMAAITFAHQENREHEWQFLPKVSINFLGESHLMQLDYAVSPNGYASSLGIKSHQEVVDWQVEWTRYDNFESWDNIDGLINKELTLRLNGNFFTPNASWNLGSKWRGMNLGEDTIRLDSKVSWLLPSFSLSNSVFWDRMGSNSRLSNRFHISGNFYDWYLRSFLDLNLSPDFGLSQWVLNASLPLTDNSNYQMELRYQQNNEAKLNLRNILSYNVKRGSIRLELNNDFKGVWQAQLRWNSSYLWKKWETSGLMERNNFLSSGSIKIVAFQDDNANGIFDDGELPLSGLTFSGHKNKLKETDINGEILITNLPTQQSHNIILNEISLPDPFLVPVDDIINVSPHPGYIQEVFFPVMYTAEIEGQLLAKQNEEYFFLKNTTRVTLVSISSDKYYQATVEYDGVFIFDNVFPGEYTLLLNKIEIQNIKVEPGEFLSLGTVGNPRKTNTS